MPGLYCPAGTLDDLAATRGDDRAQDNFALLLDNLTVETHDRRANLNLLSLSRYIREAHAAQFNGIEADMDDQFDSFGGCDTEGVAAWKELDQRSGHRSHRYGARGVDGDAVSHHFLSEYRVGYLFQIDYCAIKWRYDLNFCHLRNFLVYFYAT